jgi:hypothetical protein
MTVTYMMAIMMITALVGFAIFIFYKDRNSQQPVSPGETPLPGAIKFGTNRSVYLKCMNAKTGYYMMSALFWTLTAFLLGLTLTTSGNPAISQSSRRIIDGLFDLKGMSYLPFALIIPILYCIYKRTRISWDQGPVIGGEPVQILYYQFKKMFGNSNVIFLQSADRRWILMPATEEENKRFKDIQILRQQQAFNEVQMAELKANLIDYGAVERQFKLIPDHLKFGVITFLAAAVILLIAFN